VIKGRCVEMVKLLPGHLNPGMISKRLLSIFSRSFKSEELFHFIPGDARIEL